MKDIRELLRGADPLRYEPVFSPGQRELLLQAVLAAASKPHAFVRVESRSRIAVGALVMLMLILASLFGLRVSSPLVSDLQAAVHFEIRLAEDTPAPGLREAKVSGSNRSVYLYDEPVVTNSDIAVTRVVQGDGNSHYGVSVEFNASGAEKMRAATGHHVGKPMAILIDAQVVVAPVLRTVISTSAVVSGNFTKARAERIARGIGMR